MLSVIATANQSNTVDNISYTVHTEAIGPITA